MRRTIGCIVLILSIGFVLAGCSSEKIVSPVDFYGPPPPNPLNLKVTHNFKPYPQGAIRFSVPETSNVRLEILSATGYNIKLLVDGGLDAGIHYSYWDGTNEDGEKVDDGLFVYQLQTDSYRSWQMMLWCTDAECGGLIKDD